MLGSGSAGNSALVATDHCKILVDGGLPPQSVTRTFAVTPLATQRFQGVSLRRRGHSRCYQAPRARQTRAVRRVDENIVVKIPDRCSIVTSLEQSIIRMAVLTKICRTPQAPARSKIRAVQGVDKNVVIEVPYRCLPGAGITEHIIRVTIAIEVAYGSPAPQADFHKCGLTISDSEVPCLRRKRGIRDCIGVRTRCQHRIVRAVSKRCTISHAV